MLSPKILTDGSFGISLTGKPDEPSSPFLHFGVFDVAAMRESLPESLPVAFLRQAADQDSVGATDSRAGHIVACPDTVTGSYKKKYKNYNLENKRYV